MSTTQTDRFPSPSLAMEAADGGRITDTEIRQALEQALARSGRPLRKVLLIPPDYTRFHSYAGPITGMMCSLLRTDACEVDILPALGTHQPVSPEESRAFFGDAIHPDSLLVHNWRDDVVRIGQIPGSYVREISEGLMDTPVDIELNRRILDPSYDLVISIGQVVPHEVVGMANQSKNLFVGCGGASMISSSHMLGAFYGLERIMGKDHSPVRKLFDYAQEHTLAQVPLLYVLTVTTAVGTDISVQGLYIGRERALFEQAVALSQRKNLIFVEKPLQKVVVYLDGQEFKSTWLGNKAVYRTRMAIADGGRLLVLAPGITRFGEDPENDRLIRKYGYVGRERVLELFRENEDLQTNQSVPAHLIHGSSDGRFSITYATRLLSRNEVEGVGFAWMDYDEAVRTYNPDRLKPGFQTVEDEEIYYIPNPALGLWADRGRF